MKVRQTWHCSNDGWGAAVGPSSCRPVCADNSRAAGWPRSSRTVRAAVPSSRWGGGAKREIVISHCRYAMADGWSARMPDFTLKDLEKRVKDRAKVSADLSYT